MMETVPEISIALCTYNGQEFLREQLDSILAQTVTNWELIVCDDGSSDNTRSILEEYASKDKRMHLHFNTSNLGYNKNFEKVLSLCTAPVIAICDQDDSWHPSKLEKQYKALGDNQLLYHDSAFVDHTGHSMHVRISDKFNFYRGNRQEVFLFLNCVSGHSIMMRRSLLKHAVPFPEQFHYDQWLAFIAAGHGTIDFLEESLVNYRQHKNNNTDLLALNATTKSNRQKVAELEREKEWLRVCMTSDPTRPNPLIGALYAACRKRNASFLSISYGIIIWKNRDLLLYLLKKPLASKFFFTLRKIWGVWAKKMI